MPQLYNQLDEGVDLFRVMMSYLYEKEGTPVSLELISYSLFS